MPQVSFFPRVTTYKEVKDYSALSYYADLGAYTGILLGFSMINLQQLIVTFINWTADWLAAETGSKRMSRQNKTK